MAPACDAAAAPGAAEANSAARNATSSGEEWLLLLLLLLLLHLLLLLQLLVACWMYIACSLLSVYAGVYSADLHCAACIVPALLFCRPPRAASAQQPRSR
jgi:uncharacterized membrane protein